MEIIDIISNTLRKKVVFIFYLVVIILVLFIANHILNHYLVNLKLQNNKIESFEDINQPKQDKKEIKKQDKKEIKKQDKKEIKKQDKKEDNRINFQKELRNIIQFNNNKNRTSYSCLTNNDNLKQTGCVSKNTREAKIKFSINNKKYKHLYKNDNQIEYYNNNENLKSDNYLQYYSKKFKEYDNKSKNESKFVSTSVDENSKIPFTDNFDIKLNGEFTKDNVENTKEYNYHELSTKSSYFKDLPLRNDRKMCFKCQRPYMICNENHIPVDTTNRTSNTLSKEQRGKTLLLIEKLKKQKKTKQDDIIVDDLLQKKRKKELDSIVYKKQECCDDIRSYNKFKKRYKQNYSKNRNINKNELQNIIKFNNVK